MICMNPVEENWEQVFEWERLQLTTSIENRPAGDRLTSIPMVYPVEDADMNQHININHMIRIIYGWCYFDDGPTDRTAKPQWIDSKTSFPDSWSQQHTKQSRRRRLRPASTSSIGCSSSKADLRTNLRTEQAEGVMPPARRQSSTSEHSRRYWLMRKLFGKWFHMQVYR